jgi:hypothetical protein
MHLIRGTSGYSSNNDGATTIFDIAASVASQSASGSTADFPTRTADWHWYRLPHGP